MPLHPIGAKRLEPREPRRPPQASPPCAEDRGLPRLQAGFRSLGDAQGCQHGGAAFEYAVFDHHREVEEAREVDIFSSRPDHFILRQVPCRVVYDVQLEQPSLSVIETRRCGIRFGRLSTHQRRLLKQLLDNHASRPLPGKHPGSRFPITAF